MLDAATLQPVANATIIVTDSIGQLAALATTDSLGIFVVYLVDEPGLELAIPSDGVAGLPIEAGDILTIIVP